MKLINVNIWDDYTDDLDITPGELQETHVYIEDAEITQQQQRLYLIWLLPYMQKLVPMVRFELVESPNPEDPMLGPEFRVLGLSHVARVQLVAQLCAARLRYSNELYYHIYSES